MPVLALVPMKLSLEIICVVASKLYGVNATIIIFVFVLYCIVLYCIVLYCIVCIVCWLFFALHTLVFNFIILLHTACSEGPAEGKHRSSRVTASHP